MRKYFRRALIIMLIFALPAICIATPTACSCSTQSELYDINTNFVNTITTVFNYATNNGDCAPNGSNIYNFGSMDIYVNGEYYGTIQFTTGGNNIQTQMDCFSNG